MKRELAALVLIAGLLTNLPGLAKSSKEKFIITHIPKEDGLDEFAKINHKSVTDLVFNGGEEYEIVATVPSKNIPSLKKIAKKCKINLIQIGHVKNGSGVFLETDKTVRIRDKGWKHFRN